MFIKKIGFIFSLLFSISFFSAQNLDSLEVYLDPNDSMDYYVRKGTLPTDSILKHPIETNSTVYPKSFKEKLPTRYKDREFDYEGHKTEESFWQKLKRKIFELLSHFLGETDMNKTVGIVSVLLKIFAVILGGFIIYFIVNYIIGNKVFGFARNKKRKLDIPHQDLHEDIHEINFPESISKFENNGDYRSAIRYQYLFILKKLSDKKIIQWNPEKTNKDFVREIKSESLQNEFSHLSFIFDYIWYGEFSIDKEIYEKYKAQYQTFKP